MEVPSPNRCHTYQLGGQGLSNTPHPSFWWAEIQNPYLVFAGMGELESSIFLGVAGVKWLIKPFYLASLWLSWVLRFEEVLLSTSAGRSTWPALVVLSLGWVCEAKRNQGTCQHRVPLVWDSSDFSVLKLQSPYLCYVFCSVFVCWFSVTVIKTMSKGNLEGKGFIFILYLQA